SGVPPDSRAILLEETLHLRVKVHGLHADPVDGNQPSRLRQRAVAFRQIAPRVEHPIGDAAIGHVQALAYVEVALVTEPGEGFRLEITQGLEGAGSGIRVLLLDA